MIPVKSTIDRSLKLNGNAEVIERRDEIVPKCERNKINFEEH